MSHTFEAYSNLSASMDKIYQAHWESGNEAHSKMGFLVKKSLENSLKSKKTNWTTKMVDGKRLIVQSGSHSMGERFSHKDGRKLSVNMGNFIQWRTYSTTGTTVVGGLMKAGYTETRDEGKITGRMKVYSVNQSSVDILEKISTGKTGRAKWNKELGGYSAKSLKRFAGTHKPTNFIAEGKSSALTGASGKIEKYYATAIKRRDDLKKEPMKRTS
jgi:hypothetical protein